MAGIVRGSVGGVPAFNNFFKFYFTNFFSSLINARERRAFVYSRLRATMSTDPTLGSLGRVIVDTTKKQKKKGVGVCMGVRVCVWCVSNNVVCSVYFLCQVFHRLSRCSVVHFFKTFFLFFCMKILFFLNVVHKSGCLRKWSAFRGFPSPNCLSSLSYFLLFFFLLLLIRRGNAVFESKTLPFRGGVKGILYPFLLRKKKKKKKTQKQKQNKNESNIYPPIKKWGKK